MPSDTLTIRREGAVLFVGINNPPMKLLGPELRWLTNLFGVIGHRAARAEDVRRDRGRRSGVGGDSLGIEPG